MVSIIIPNYNHAKFLRQRIESVLGQTYRDFEVVILDDCSKDDSREIILEYASGRDGISVDFNTVNSGNPFWQWQKGISLAKGEWIWIAESDDYADPTLLARLMARLEKNPKASIAYCQSHFVDQDNQIIGNHIRNLVEADPDLWKNDFCLPGKEVLSRYMVIFNIIPNASAVVFSKSGVQRVDWARVQGYQLCGDHLFWAMLMEGSDICFVAESLNYFRMGDSTVRSKFDASPVYLLERLRIMQFINSIVEVPDEVRKKCINSLRKHYLRMRKKGAGFTINDYVQTITDIYRFDPKHILRNLKILFP